MIVPAAVVAVMGLALGPAPHAKVERVSDSKLIVHDLQGRVQLSVGNDLCGCELGVRVLRLKHQHDVSIRGRRIVESALPPGELGDDGNGFVHGPAPVDFVRVTRDGRTRTLRPREVRGDRVMVR